MNVDLLDRLAIVYLEQKKKPEDAYKLAIEAIRASVEAHKKLDVILNAMIRRGEI